MRGDSKTQSTEARHGTSEVKTSRQKIKNKKIKILMKKVNVIISLVSSTKQKDQDMSTNQQKINGGPRSARGQYSYKIS